MTALPIVILHASDLHFSHPGNKLFDGYSIDIGAGVTVVRGGDGSGKSSLLRLLAGAVSADSGTLAIGAVELARQADDYRRQVFWIEPRSEQFDQITPRAYFASLAPRYPAFDQGMLDHVINGLSLAPHLDKQLYMLSTGSKRKVWLAAALAAGATVNLLDDPLAGLDRVSINFFFDQLKRAAANPAQAWVLAMYEAPADLPLAAILELT
ncbi:MAG: ABC transporter ATP-binding protein [Janthinobacterium lividum]